MSIFLVPHSRSHTPSDHSCRSNPAGCGDLPQHATRARPVSMSRASQHRRGSTTRAATVLFLWVLLLCASAMPSTSAQEPASSAGPNGRTEGSRSLKASNRRALSQAIGNDTEADAASPPPPVHSAPTETLSPKVAFASSSCLVTPAMLSVIGPRCSVVRQGALRALPDAVLTHAGTVSVNTALLNPNSLCLRLLSLAALPIGRPASSFPAHSPGCMRRER